MFSTTTHSCDGKIPRLLSPEDTPLDVRSMHGHFAFGHLDRSGHFFVAVKSLGGMRGMLIWGGCDLSMFAVVWVA